MFSNSTVPGYKNILKYKIPLAVIGLIGTLTVLYLISIHGAGISPDSVYYISVARHIADGTGFVGYDGYYLLLQPPLYPILLASIKILLFIDPLLSSGYVNSILFGLIIYFSGLFLLKHLDSYILIILGTISVLISFVLIQLSLMALSESLFILLILLYLYYFDNYKVRGNITALILLSFAAALACLTRYIGVIIILSGIISISLQKTNLIKDKFRYIIIFMFIACVPIGLWVIRNIFLSGTFVGQRADSSYTLYDNIRFLANTIIQWYLPMQNTIQKLIFTCLIVVISFGVILLKRKEKTWVVLKEIYPCFIFILLYTGIILISSTTTAYDHIGDRLLSPIYIPVFFILFIICDKILKWLSKYFNRKLITIFFAAGIFFWMIYPLGKTVYIINDYMKLSGFGYNSRYWGNSETIKFLIDHKELKNDYTFYSNIPEGLYFLADIEARWSPAKTLYNSPELVNAGSNFREILKGKDKVCLVWFDKNDRQFLYPIDELQKSTNMIKVARFKDGTIYIITK
jgi:hypothetical protein